MKGVRAVGEADYTDGRLTEAEQIETNRYLEALAAGFSLEEARVFAHDTGIDIGQLRRLLRAGATGSEIARILL